MKIEKKTWSERVAEVNLIPLEIQKKDMARHRLLLNQPSRTAKEKREVLRLNKKYSVATWEIGG